VSYQVVPNKFPKESINELVERNRLKGRGILRKKPIEQLSYLQPILWPVNRFELTYSLNKNNNKNPRLFTNRLFMLGMFSLSYVENKLINEDGIKALNLIFSREDANLLQILSHSNQNLPMLSSFDPSSIYRKLTQVYDNQRNELEKEIEKIREELKPQYEEAIDYENKAVEIREKAIRMKKKRKNLQYKELSQLASTYKNRAQKLKKEADKKIKTYIRKYEKYVKNWYKGNRRYLNLKKESNIENITKHGIFYNAYWIARFESSDSIRYLIINNRGQQERKLQEMLFFDSHLQNEIDKLMNFTSKTKVYTCYVCGKPIEKSNSICSQCGNTVIKCIVCKLPINKDAQIGQCPLCKSNAHFSHLYEWIKTQGKCPHCLQAVLVETIISLEMQIEE